MRNRIGIRSARISVDFPAPMLFHGGSSERADNQHIIPEPIPIGPIIILQFGIKQIIIIMADICNLAIRVLALVLSVCVIERYLVHCPSLSILF